MTGPPGPRDEIRPEIRVQEYLMAPDNAEMGARLARRLIEARDYADFAAADAV